MTALGQTRLFDDVDAMSAAPPIATECCSAVSGASGLRGDIRGQQIFGNNMASAVLFDRQPINASVTTHFDAESSRALYFGECIFSISPPLMASVMSALRQRSGRCGGALSTRP
jgi:hypothetical protein